MGSGTDIRLVVLLAVALCCGCPPTPDTRRSKPLAIGALVLDVSGLDAPELRCDEAAARARDLIARAGPMPVDLLVLATGDAATGYEPQVLLPWTRFADDRATLYADQDGERRRAAWIEAVRKDCAARIRTRHVSPVFRALARALESIEARCAERERFGETCALKALAIHSDLVENVEPSIARHLKSAKDRSPPTLPTLELGGVELAVCGRSEHHAVDASARERPVVEVWSAVLGRPLKIDAACPRLEAATTERAP